jgi:hypothetical protein
MAARDRRRLGQPCSEEYRCRIVRMTISSLRRLAC